MAHPIATLPGVSRNLPLAHRHCALSPGTSGDMRDLLAAEASGNDRARLAIDTFCYSLVKTIGAYYVALQGLDRLVFTGGIGEKGASIRSRVLNSLTCLGIEMDEERNTAGGVYFIAGVECA